MGKHHVPNQFSVPLVRLCFGEVMKLIDFFIVGFIMQMRGPRTEKQQETMSMGRRMQTSFPSWPTKLRLLTIFKPL